jgi:hypothetical protein
MLKLDVGRREFLRIAAGAGAGLAMPTLGHTAVSSKMMISAFAVPADAP